MLRHIAVSFFGNPAYNDTSIVFYMSPADILLLYPMSGVNSTSHKQLQKTRNGHLPEYAEEIPHAKDVLLIIEVADTSLEYDREVKLPQYAEGGIPELWLVNLKDNVIEVHWEPMGNDYKFRELLRTGDVVKTRNFELNIPVNRVL